MFLCTQIFADVISIWNSGTPMNMDFIHVPGFGFRKIYSQMPFYPF